MKTELIAELRKLGKEIRDSGRENIIDNDNKLKRVAEIMDLLLDIMPDEEFCELATKINKDEEMEM